MDTARATSKTFQAAVGATFQCKAESAEIPLVLDNIKMLSQAGMRDEAIEFDDVVIPVRAPFALTFEGPREPVLSQGLYRLLNDELGELDLFIVPFRQDAACTLYESIFN